MAPTCAICFVISLLAVVISGMSGDASLNTTTTEPHTVINTTTEPHTVINTATEPHTAVNITTEPHTAAVNKTTELISVTPPSTTSPTTLAPTAKDVGTSETSSTTSPFVRDGTCIRYQGELCSALLNKTLQEQDEKPLRFIDNRLGINKTDWIILQFMKAIDRIDDEERRCKGILRTILCQYTLPPCNQYGVPRNYCREDCDEVFKTCGRALRELLGAAKSITDFLGINFVHIGIPNCTQFKYSDEFTDTNGTCLHLGVFDFTKGKRTDEEKPLPIPLLIGATFGIIALAGFVIFLIIRKRRNRRKKCGFRGVTFTAVTMRDRLRAETLRALDETKVLSLYNPDDLIQFPLDRIQYVKDLGEGNFGQVFQGRAFGLLPTDKPDTELMVAVKTLKEGSSKEMKASFLQEVTLMAVLHHTNIVELLAVSTEEEPYGMIFEFMSQGDLNQFLRDRGPYSLDEEEKPGKQSLTQEDLLSISLQVSSGMEHLQSMRFVHRDLATRNCLVGEGLVVKIADFGMSRDVYASDYYKVEGQAVMPIRWMPPEALLYGKFTVESDVYSFGVLLWEVYTFALQPYYGYTNEEVCEFIKKGVHLGKPEECPDHVYDAMKDCWKKDPSQRPNFEVIISQLKNEEHPYNIPTNSAPAAPQQPMYMNMEITNEADDTTVINPLAAPTRPGGYVNVSIEANSPDVELDCSPLDSYNACAGRVNPTFEDGEQAV